MTLLRRKNREAPGRSRRSFVLEHPESADDETLEFMLVEFRRMEEQRFEAIRSLDEKIKGTITASSIQVAALGLVLRDDLNELSFARNLPLVVALATFFCLLTGTFWYATRAWQVVVVGYTPDPPETWNKFLDKGVNHFKYAITKWIAEDFAQAHDAIEQKGEWTEKAINSLIGQTAMLGLILVLALI